MIDRAFPLAEAAERTADGSGEHVGKIVLTIGSGMHIADCVAMQAVERCTPRE